MVKYRRLTPEERYQIEALLNSGLSLRAIGRQMLRSPSSICRELHKSSSHEKKVYLAYEAQRVTTFRRGLRYVCRYKIQGALEKYVRGKLLEDWSPEQIAGRLKLNGILETLSHQTIYRYLERQKNQGKEDPNTCLRKHLRILRKQRKDRKKPQWKPAPQPFPQRTFLKDRPKIVEKRNRLGDFERDTVFGAFNGPLLLTLVDRTSRLVKIAWLPKKSSHLVHLATVRLLKDEPIKTITNDNGSEFVRHQQTAKCLKASIYFSRSYCSWERGTNENTNGLLRQYFPRRKDIGILSSRQIRAVELKLNSRPRKCLGYSTPQEVHTRLRSPPLR